MQRAAVLGLAGLVAAGFIAALIWWRPAPDKLPPPSVPAPAPAKQEVPPLLKAPSGKLEPPPAQDKTGWIVFPDGSSYPPLNGVKVAPKIGFHPRMAPYAPVVRIERDASGRDWYVHENGVRSTMYIDDRGETIGMAERPAAAQPSADPPEGKK